LATTVTTVYSVGGIAGRFVGGVLLDLFPRYRVAPLVLVVSALGALALTGVGVLPFVLVIVAALLVSFSQGAEGDFVSYFILKEYGRAHFGKLFAAVYVMTGVGALLGTYAFGITRDLTGGYAVACIVAACCFLAGAATMVVFGVLGRRSRRAAAATTPAESAA
jgi:MFS family permease